MKLLLYARPTFEAIVGEFGRRGILRKPTLPRRCDLSCPELKYRAYSIIQLAS